MVGKYPPDKHGDIPMAEFASRRESVDKPSSKRDPQLQQIMDLTTVSTSNALFYALWNADEYEQRYV